MTDGASNNSEGSGYRDAVICRTKRIRSSPARCKKLDIPACRDSTDKARRPAEIARERSSSTRPGRLCWERRERSSIVIEVGWGSPLRWPMRHPERAGRRPLRLPASAGGRGAVREMCDLIIAHERSELMAIREIGGTLVGRWAARYIVAEIGINHNGDSNWRSG